MMLPTVNFSFGTDTATFAVFDPLLLSHRLNDRPDWWAIPDEEIAEINAGHMITAALGEDGDYCVQLLSEEVNLMESLHAYIEVRSGIVYAGAGEDIVGGGWQPSAGSLHMSGYIIELSPGNYRCSVSRTGIRSLSIAFSPTDNTACNSFSCSPRI